MGRSKVAWADVNWSQKDDYHMESTTGYRISKAHTAAACFYYAWGRVVARELLLKRYKARYQRGESIPQPRSLLGVYKTARAAKQACEQDLIND